MMSTRLGNEFHVYIFIYESDPLRVNKILCYIYFGANIVNTILVGGAERGLVRQAG